MKWWNRFMCFVLGHHYSQARFTYTDAFEKCVRCGREVPKEHAPWR